MKGMIQFIVGNNCLSRHTAASVLRTSGTYSSCTFWSQLYVLVADAHVGMVTYCFKCTARQRARRAAGGPLYPLAVPAVTPMAYFLDRCNARGRTPFTFELLTRHELFHFVCNSITVFKETCIKSIDDIQRVTCRARACL